eukprot:7391998-Prymnesium_polylepis.1
MSVSGKLTPPSWLDSRLRNSTAPNESSPASISGASADGSDPISSCATRCATGPTAMSHDLEASTCAGAAVEALKADRRGIKELTFGCSCGSAASMCGASKCSVHHQASAKSSLRKLSTALVKSAS